MDRTKSDLSGDQLHWLEKQVMAGESPVIWLEEDLPPPDPQAPDSQAPEANCLAPHKLPPPPDPPDDPDLAA